MSDLISRQDAIDAINHICPIDTEYDCALLDRVDVRCVLSDLPSAEPEQIIKIGQRSGKTLESAIDYLHSVGWLQEHDRVLTESAEPEQKCAKDARCSEQTAKILNRSEGFYSAHGVCICGHCEQCGNAVCDDFRFCPYCGTALDWSE